MITPEEDGRVIPVLIFDGMERLAATGLINEKGYRKSIERSEAWLLDGVSGRLLPDARCSGMKSIQKHADHIEMRVKSFQADAAGPERVESGPGSTEIKDKEGEGKAGSVAAVPVAGVGDAGSTSPSSGGTDDLTEKLLFLAELENLIERRRREMPEGSYTTHLFEKGEEKIRKKTGEEAIELLLARENNEIASEAADLIYHMMVLFVAKGMSLGQALDVLITRHG